MRQVISLTTALKISVLCLFAIPGCKGGIASRIFGSDTVAKTQDAHESYVVSCCQDNDGAGHLSYPSFLPTTHVQLCQRAEVACRTNDCHIGADVYLPMSVDCGRTPYKIGDSYYPKTGY